VGWRSVLISITGNSYGNPIIPLHGSLGHESCEQENSPLVAFNRNDLQEPIDKNFY